MGIRDYIASLSPPWLDVLDENGKPSVGGGILYAATTQLDAVGQWLTEGIKARFPDTAPPDALGYIGNDRQIDRGPAEGPAGYAVRLRQAIDTWRNAGGARTVLSQLAAYFTNVATPPMRLVSDHSVWHVYDWITGASTKTVVSPANWIWDAFTGTRWWRGWAIVDTSAGPFTRHLWGSGGTWGGGGVWGVDEPPGGVKVADLIRIIKRWKPAHVDVHYLILTFDATLFLSSDLAPPNPNGNYDNPANRDARATYIPVGT